ncbi:hypothetical protein BB561_001202 [Smittium simulii]|uniref:Uncharacterized protein n=1 Tax=Smittium simulii TaxID=133385 RepID=A0A2T9YVT1_9FUNG|nr:hypothetical protein BB561_001202 [Smittium simulii]
MSVFPSNKFSTSSASELASSLIAHAPEYSLVRKNSKKRVLESDNIVDIGADSTDALQQIKGTSNSRKKHKSHVNTTNLNKNASTEKNKISDKSTLANAATSSVSTSTTQSNNNNVKRVTGRIFTPIELSRYKAERDRQLQQLALDQRQAAVLASYHQKNTIANQLTRPGTTPSDLSNQYQLATNLAKQASQISAIAATNTSIPTRFNGASLGLAGGLNLQHSREQTKNLLDLSSAISANDASNIKYSEAAKKLEISRFAIPNLANNSLQHSQNSKKQSQSTLTGHKTNSELKSNNALFKPEANQIITNIVPNGSIITDEMIKLQAQLSSLTSNQTSPQGYVNFDSSLLARKNSIDQKNFENSVEAQSQKSSQNEAHNQTQSTTDQLLAPKEMTNPDNLNLKPSTPNSVNLSGNTNPFANLTSAQQMQLHLQLQLKRNLQQKAELQQRELNSDKGFTNIGINASKQQSANSNLIGSQASNQMYLNQSPSAAKVNLQSGLTQNSGGMVTLQQAQQLNRQIQISLQIVLLAQQQPGLPYLVKKQLLVHMMQLQKLAQTPISRMSSSSVSLLIQSLHQQQIHVQGLVVATAAANSNTSANLNFDKNLNPSNMHNLNAQNNSNTPKIAINQHSNNMSENILNLNSNSKLNVNPNVGLVSNDNNLRSVTPMTPSVGINLNKNNDLSTKNINTPNLQLLNSMLSQSNSNTPNFNNMKTPVVTSNNQTLLQNPQVWLNSNLNHLANHSGQNINPNSNPLLTQNAFNNLANQRAISQILSSNSNTQEQLNASNFDNSPHKANNFNNTNTQAQQAQALVNNAILTNNAASLTSTDTNMSSNSLQAQNSQNQQNLFHKGNLNMSMSPQVNISGQNNGNVAVQSNNNYTAPNSSNRNFEMLSNNNDSTEIKISTPNSRNLSGTPNQLVEVKTSLSNKSNKASNAGSPSPMSIKQAQKPKALTSNAGISKGTNADNNNNNIENLNSNNNDASNINMNTFPFTNLQAKDSNFNGFNNSQNHMLQPNGANKPKDIDTNIILAPDANNPTTLDANYNTGLNNTWPNLTPLQLSQLSMQQKQKLAMQQQNINSQGQLSMNLPKNLNLQQQQLLLAQKQKADLMQKQQQANLQLLQKQPTQFQQNPVLLSQQHQQINQINNINQKMQEIGKLNPQQITELLELQKNLLGSSSSFNPELMARALSANTTTTQDGISLFKNGIPNFNFSGQQQTQTMPNRNQTATMHGNLAVPNPDSNLADGNTSKLNVALNNSPGKFSSVEADPNVNNSDLNSETVSQIIQKALTPVSNMVSTPTGLSGSQSYLSDNASTTPQNK